MSVQGIECSQKGEFCVRSQWEALDGGGKGMQVSSTSHHITDGTAVFAFPLGGTTVSLKDGLVWG